MSTALPSSVFTQPITPEWFEPWFDARFPPKETIDYTLIDVADRVGVSQGIVRTAFREGALGGFELGPRTVVIPRVAIRSWLLSCYCLNTES